MKENMKENMEEKKKFAFIMMGPDHAPKEPARFDGSRIQAYAYAVKSFEEAQELAVKLKEEGFGAIELCGAFGRDRARELIRLTENQVAIGYVVHEAEQDSLFDQFFGA